MIAADRGRAGDARNSGLLEGFARCRLVGIEPADQIAFGDDPAAGVARRDEERSEGAVILGAIGQGGNLVDDSLRFSAPLAVKTQDGEHLSYCTK
jgi:hypothetical protein